MTQSQIDPPVTADRTERRAASRKRRVPRTLLLAPVALVAIGVALILFLGGGKSGGIINTIIHGGEDDTVPPFDFRIAKTTAVATAAGADKGALRDEAATLTGQDVAPVLDALYTDAFLDPANWRHDDYGSVVALFSGDAASSVQQDLETLTLGADAGDRYDTVTPTKGSLKFSVLFDQDGNPDTVVATVSFTALGAGKDGTYTAIVSTGQYFLRDENGWKVTAYEVRRLDHPTQAPPPSPGPSGSPSVTGTG